MRPKITQSGGSSRKATFSTTYELPHSAIARIRQARANQRVRVNGISTTGAAAAPEKGLPV